MKQSIPYILIIALVIALRFVIFSFGEKQSYQMPTYETDNSFKSGEILLPDYVHLDTLVVLDGLRLTWHIQSPDVASDEEISEILGEYTIPIQDVRFDTAYYFPIIRMQENVLQSY